MLSRIQKDTAANWGDFLEAVIGMNLYKVEKLARDS